MAVELGRRRLSHGRQRYGLGRRSQPPLEWRLWKAAFLATLGCVALLMSWRLWAKPAPALGARLSSQARSAALYALLSAGYRVANSARGQPAIYLLRGTPQAPAAVAFLVGSAPSQALFTAQVVHSSSVLPWRIRAVRLIAGATGNPVTAFARVPGTFAYTLGSGRVTAVLVIRDLARQQTQTFRFATPARDVQLTPVAGKTGWALLVRYRPVQGISEQAVIQHGAGGWRSQTPAFQVVAAQARAHPPFIRLVETIRSWLGPRPVAMIEDLWYGLVDAIQRRLYWLHHPVPHVTASAADQQVAKAAAALVQAARASRGVSAPERPPVTRAVQQHATSAAPQTFTRPAATPRALVQPAPAAVPGQPPVLSLPAAWPRVAGEGVWRPAGRLVNGHVAMERTFVLPDPQRPYTQIDLVWINPRLARLHIVAGTRHPHSTAGLHGAGEVPLAARPFLLAAFNGGFKRIGGHYAHFGFRANGLWYILPAPRLATLAVYPSRKVALGSWGREVPVSPTPRGVLQNLPLLVDHGQVSPLIDNGAAWGETVGNAVRVWRSGLGITAAGDLIYAAGRPLTARTLAVVLALAGARRAMELDINSYWVTFNFYWPIASGSAQMRGEKLMPDMTRSAIRYLAPDSRDFIYLTAAHS
ncbi:MAG: phosphodiester glycosidase family protein [Chloroflexi bacterium]|nr:phosphodiester glycosidase family protein [Chloroflexota bacterium]